jgi:hypothetical protein
VRKAHATQHVGRLGELDVVVTDYLHAVAPGIAEIKERTIEQANARCLECLAGRRLIVDDEAEMPAIVRRLLAAFLQRDELVAQIDERHRVALAAEFEPEQPAVKCQGFLDVPDLERDVIEAHQAWFCHFSHRVLPPRDRRRGECRGGVAREGYGISAAGKSA